MARFTDKFIKGLGPKVSRYDVREGDGFCIRVFPSGVKSWFYVYAFEGKRRRLTLGNYPAVSLSVARRRHRQAKDLRDDGVDPAAKKTREKEGRLRAPNVETFFREEYLKRHAKANKQSWAEDERIIEKDIIPSWRSRKLEDIDKRDVLLLVEGIVDRGAPVMANRTLALLKKAFKIAVKRDVIPVNPCVDVEKPYKETERDRFLVTEEIRKFWRGLDDSQLFECTKRVLKFILVTGQRPGECTGLHWDEIRGDWWTIPKERTKNGIAHRVYLSSLSKSLLGEENGGYVFPSQDGGGSITTTSLNGAITNNLERFGISDHLTPHDLRRTAASHLAAMGYGVIVGKILNHKERGVVRIYDRHSYDKEKQTALEAWSRHVEAIITGRRADNVIPLSR